MRNNLQPFITGVLTFSLINSAIQTNPETQEVDAISAKTRPRLAQAPLLVTTSLMRWGLSTPLLVQFCTPIATLILLRHLGHMDI